jgi:hypothetical protein
MTGTLERTDTGTHAIVRVIDPGVHVSAPYSRAVGLLDKWAKAERHAVDEFAAWIEGQAAQAKAEMRLLCDEEAQQHRQVREQMKDRIQSWINLPASFLDLPFAWAELPVATVPVGFDREDALNRMVRQNRFVAQRPAITVEQYMDADTGDDMPGRLPRTMLEPTSIDFDDDIDPPDIPMKRKGWTPQGTFPLATREPDDMLIVHRKITDEEADRIKRYWQERHGRPVEVKVQTGPRGRFTRWLDEQLQRPGKWWRRKVAERDARMGLED